MQRVVINTRYTYKRERERERVRSINESEQYTISYSRKFATEIALHDSIDRLIPDGDTFRSRPANKFAKTVRFRAFCTWETSPRCFSRGT